MSTTSRIPYVTQWNFSLQHSIKTNNMVELDYLGAEGHKGQNRYDVDQCVPDTTLYCNPATRPWPRYVGVLMYDNNGNSEYNALVVKFRHQFSQGLTFLADYTYSKSLLDGYEGATGQDDQITTCRRCDWGLSAANVPQTLRISTVYDLPFGRNRRFASQMPKAADYFLGGWQFTGIQTFADRGIVHRSIAEYHSQLICRCTSEPSLQWAGQFPQRKPAYRRDAGFQHFLLCLPSIRSLWRRWARDFERARSE